MTPKEINALPTRVRDYIHDLETNVDPAGTLQQVFALKQNQARLQSKIVELKGKIRDDWYTV